MKKNTSQPELVLSVTSPERNGGFKSDGVEVSRDKGCVTPMTCFCHCERIFISSGASTGHQDFKTDTEHHHQGRQSMNPSQGISITYGESRRSNPSSDRYDTKRRFPLTPPLTKPRLPNPKSGDFVSRRAASPADFPVKAGQRERDFCVRYRIRMS